MIRRALPDHHLLLRTVQRLRVAHQDLTRLVTICRDAGAVVWSTGAPAGGFNVEGWREHFEIELQQLVAARDQIANLATRFPALQGPLQDYCEAVPRIRDGLVTLLNAPRYRNGGGALIAIPLTAAHRAALADGIEAELEA